MIAGEHKMAFTPFQENQKIFVSTQKIREQAKIAKTLCQRIIGNMKIIENSVEKSTSFCESSSFDLLYKYFQEDKLDFNDIKKRLYSQIEKLDEIAALYEDTEEKSKEEAETLPNSIIK